MPEPDEIFQSDSFEAAVEAAKSGNVTTAQQQTIETPTTPEPVTTSESTDTTTQATIPTNYAEYLKTASEGFFESEEKFKEFIPKIKNYDSLEAKLTELEKSVPQFKNDESKAWFDLLSSGDEKALSDYLSEKHKDYKTMSDLDVRREALSKANPSWDKQEVELEIRTTYGDDLEKINLEEIEKEDELGKVTQEYRDAVAHNKEVDRNLLLLSRDARDDRHKLIDQQSKIELPKLNKAETPATPQGPTPEEIADATEKWKARVREQLPTLPNIKQNIDNKEVEYVQSDDDKKELATIMENFNIFTYAKTRGWVDENGVSNPLRIAEDVQKLRDFDKITNAFATQVKTATTKQVMGKIKNIDDTHTPPIATAFESLADAAHAAKADKGWK